METPAFENNSKTFTKDLEDAGLKFDTFSQSQSRNRTSKSPLSRGNVSPQYYSSSISYQRASQISPTLEIESKLIEKQNPLKNYDQKQFPKTKVFDFNPNNRDSQLEPQKKTSPQNAIKEIANLKEKIKEQQFLIELENAVHKELMNILSKKDKSLTSLKTQKLDGNSCYEIQEQTQAYLDKAESYVKEMKKLEQIANTQYS